MIRIVPIGLLLFSAACAPTGEEQGGWGGGGKADGEGWPVARHSYEADAIIELAQHGSHDQLGRGAGLGPSITATLMAGRPYHDLVDIRMTVPLDAMEHLRAYVVAQGLVGSCGDGKFQRLAEACESGDPGCTACRYPEHVAFTQVLPGRALMALAAPDGDVFVIDDASGAQTLRRLGPRGQEHWQSHMQLGQVEQARLIQNDWGDAIMAVTGADCPAGLQVGDMHLGCVRPWSVLATFDEHDGVVDDRNTVLYEDRIIELFWLNAYDRPHVGYLVREGDRYNLGALDRYLRDLWEYRLSRGPQRERPLVFPDPTDGWYCASAISGKPGECSSPGGEDSADMAVPDLPLTSQGPGGPLAYDHDGRLVAIYPERSPIPPSLPLAGRRIEAAYLVEDRQVLLGLEEPDGYAVVLVAPDGKTVWERHLPLSGAHLASAGTTLATVIGSQAGQPVVVAVSLL